MLVSVQGGLFRVNGMSLQAIVAFVAVVMRAHKTDWQAELNLFELLPARAFPPSISVSFLVPALACFPFPATRNPDMEYHVHSVHLNFILPCFSVELCYICSYCLPGLIRI